MYTYILSEHMLPKVVVTFADFTWESGVQLIDVDITLGSAEKSSSCKVLLSDLNHSIAEAVINHSIKTGGIVSIAKDTKSDSGTKSNSVTKSNTGNSKGWGSPEQHAFADMVAWKETQAAKDGDFPKSYLARNGIGDMPASAIAPGAGFPPPQPGGGNVGRYQFNKGDWQDAVKAGYAKDYTPEDQDGIARYKFDKLDRGGKELAAGDFEAAREKANNEWKSVPGKDMSQIQPGTTKREYYLYYKTQLAKYKGAEIPSPTIPKTVLAKPDETDTDQAVIKGSLIVVSVGSYSFEFYHQGTDMADDGKTILTGQGLRWLMSRRKVNRTLKDITLKQLANSVAKEQKVKLDYQTKLDPTYIHLDQSGITNYALLLREADAAGLMVTEDMKAKTLVVKDREGLAPASYTLARGVNLISYQISDRALSGNEPDISTNEPQAAKTVIDPVAGKQVNVKPEVVEKVIKQDVATTGATKPKVSGTLTTGNNANSASKTKRIAGLPSTFVVPLSDSTLQFNPLTTILTEGFPGCLDRIWVIKTVSHSLSKNTSTLVLNSPVQVVNVVKPETKKDAIGITANNWVYPTSGTVTSIQSANRNGRRHNGADIANVAGTIIYAAASGTVITNQFEKGGAGWYIQLKHKNGFFSSYFHMLEASPLKVMQDVVQGDQIGKMGTTGGSTGVHLHFEIARNSPTNRVQVADILKDLGAKGNVITQLLPS